MYDHKAFGRKLKHLRITNNLSQNELSLLTEKIAKKFNRSGMKISQSYISGLEKCVGKAISIEKLYSLSVVFNVTMDDLVSDSLNKSKKQQYNALEKMIYDKLITFNGTKMENFIRSIENFYYYKTGNHIDN